ncbi:MAG: translation initiation factor IF-2 N-terminal domain-containing protein, partial [Ignavibacteriaceae bacterium]|nr:translation initiation factor IF-2 N-terminal domain-containing protein [Ignavibacteriaceae bacterium]
MPETKAKKLRVYKLASEYNLTVETLTEFLIKKGFEVKSHMSILSDEMIDAISDHFKKDIERAEKHYKKIEEFQKKRDKSRVDEKEKEDEKIAAEAALANQVEEPLTEIVEGVEVETLARTEAVEEIKSEDETDAVAAVEETATAQVAEKDAEEISSVDTLAPEAAEAAPQKEEAVKPDEAKAKPVEAVKSEEPAKSKKRIFVSPKELEARKKKGLTVIGKIDLGGKKKHVFKEEVEKEKPETTGDKKVELVKKKKKVKSKKKIGTPEPEETAASKKKKKTKRFEIDQREVDEAIKKTLLSMDDAN